jgi:hypothetical protein
MITYKITNLTGTLPKRASKYNTVATFNYADGLMKKTINIKPNDVAYLTVDRLPIGVHHLRILKLVDVTQVNKSEIPKEKIVAPVATVVPHSQSKKVSKKVSKRENQTSEK